MTGFFFNTHVTVISVFTEAGIDVSGLNGISHKPALKIRKSKIIFLYS